jgi:hypothetical protein
MAILAIKGVLTRNIVGTFINNIALFETIVLNYCSSSKYNFLMAYMC